MKLINKKRQVRILFSKGGEINTSMSSHLKDEEIKEYYKIGTYFNLGSLEDDMQKVINVEILN